MLFSMTVKYYWRWTEGIKETQHRESNDTQNKSTVSTSLLLSLAFSINNTNIYVIIRGIRYSHTLTSFRLCTYMHVYRYNTKRKKLKYTNGFCVRLSVCIEHNQLLTASINHFQFDGGANRLWKTYREYTFRSANVCVRSVCVLWRCNKYTSLY